MDAAIKERFLKTHGEHAQWWFRLVEWGVSIAEVFTDGGASCVAVYEPGQHRDEAVLLIEELLAHDVGIRYLITDDCDDSGLCDTYGIACLDCDALTPEHGLDFVVVLSDDDFYHVKERTKGRTCAEIISLDGLIALVNFKYGYYRYIAKTCIESGAKLCVLEWAYAADFKNSDLYKAIYKGACEPRDFQANPEHFKELYRDIEEYSPEYIREIFTERPMISRDGRVVHIDCRGRYVNIINNRRYTVGQPDDCDCEVHVFGGCNAFGFGTDDRYTIASALQGMINDHYGSAKDSKYAVYNWGLWGGGSDLTDAILEHSNRKKIVLYVMRGDFLYPKGGDKKVFRYIETFLKRSGADYISLAHTLELAEEQEGVYIDVAHVNHRGHRAVAKKVFADYLKPMLDADANLYKKNHQKMAATPEDLTTLVSDLAGCANVCLLQWPDANEVMTQPLPSSTDYGYYTVHLYNDVAEISQNYMKEVLMQAGPIVSKKKKDVNEIRNTDIKGKFVNVAGGCRKTVEQPSVYDRRVFIFGDGVAFGFGADDRFTIASVLQGLLNSHCEKTPNAPRYGVLNEGLWNGDGAVSDEFILKNKILPKLNSGMIKRDDIILWLQNRRYTAAEREYLEAHGFCCMDLTPALQMTQKSKPLYVDKRHANHRGYKMAATKVYFDYIKKILEDVPQVFPALTDDLNAEFHEYLAYLEREKTAVVGSVGAIVMNCNPFTRGHRYLVEKAAAEVDFLYVFIVEEDKSSFKFEDRLILVQKGLSDFKNVKVLKSGKFIISTITFPGYFSKDSAKSVAVDTSLDVSLFIEHIVPALGIGVRFVGNEPLCPITKQYNNTMRAMLPKSGVRFVEYERTELSGEPISASRVRALLEEGTPASFEELKKWVPQTTYDYLRENYMDKTL